MCVKYRNILNNSNHYCSDCDKMYMRVPCGHCEECAEQLRKDWFVRCYYQYVDTPHFATFFYTLTYNDEHLPMFHNLFPCFNKRDVQLFLKRLRKSLVEFSITLKYMITSEFGEKKGRPHYHALFFLSKPINSFTFYRLVREAWTNGFIMPGENNGVVYKTSGISYVTKYVTKDFVYSDKFLSQISERVLSRYRNVIRLFCMAHGSISITCDEYGSIHYKCGKLVTLSQYGQVLAKYILTRIKREIRKYLPFHLQSTKLGIGLLDKDKNFDNEFIYIMDSKGIEREYNLPRYIKRKLWYDAVPNEKDGKCNLFRLNEQGKLHYKSKIEERVAQSVLKFDTIKDNMRLLRDDAPVFISKLCDTKFQEIEDIDDLIFNAPYSSHELALYDVIFRDRVCPINNISLEYNVIFDSSYDYAERCIEHIQKFDFGRLADRSPQLRDILNRHLWNRMECFQLLERYVQVLDAVNHYIKTQVSDATRLQEKRSRKTRDYLKYV